MNRILVPYDFSECAQNALDFAYQIALHSGGEIKILHIIDYPSSTAFQTQGEVVELDGQDDVFIIAAVKRLKEKLNAIVQEDRFNGLTISYDLKFGNPFESIGRHIAEYDTDLVVIGTQGASGMEEALIGTNTERVVRFATCPVISIREKLKVEDIKNIAFGIDPDDQQAPALKLFKEYQRIFKARLHMVWVNTPHIIENENAVKQKMTGLAEACGISNFEVHVFNDVIPESGLIRFADENEIDFMALTTHSRKGLVHLISGSTAEDLVNHSQRPVWTYSLTSI